MQSFGHRRPLNGWRPMVWAFTPYLIRDHKLIGESYDDHPTKAELACAFQVLGLPWIWQPIVPDSMDAVIAQVAKYRETHDAVVLNLCDGDDVNGYPGVSVPKALEAADIPFTGAEPLFYELSTSKIRTKEALIEAEVSTPPFAILPQSGSVQGFCERLGTPLFVKPAVSAAGWGLTLRSVVFSDQEIAQCRDELTSGGMAQYFADDTLFVERFIDGPEFTVFVGGFWDRPEEIWTLPPAERVFNPAIPDRERILCNERLGRPYYHYDACEPSLAEPLKEVAIRAYRAVQGSSYGRVDIRQDRATGALYVLEVNANPGISGDEEVVSVGCILRLADMTFPDLLAALLHQTLSRCASLPRAQTA